MLKYHMTAFFLGFLLDLLLGDPYWLPHPIRLIGNLIAALDRKLLGNPEESERNDHREFLKEFHRGIVLVALVLLSVTLVTAALLLGGYALHPYIGLVLETIMTYQILAAKCLKVESMKVYACLKRGDLPAARKAVSMIVGRDTDVLDETGVARAAIETVAENTSDGVIAPMLYLALGGPVLGFFYKTVNTMDSMVGYKNDRYLYFGRVAAKLDDVVNFFPARISAYLMILSAFVGGSAYDGKRAFQIHRRDRRNHASPNSAQTEAACAGALGLQLAGDAWYFGERYHKPTIGDPMRDIEDADIIRANCLMYGASILCLVLCVVIRYILVG